MESVEYNMQNINMSVIEDYPSEEIMSFLQYVQNGDDKNALNVLDKIFEYISNQVETAQIKRYMCYDILTSYFKLLQKIMYPLSKHETKALLIYNNINELHTSLSSSVTAVCQSLSQRKNSLYKSRQIEILQYINSNFTDQSMCREKVADHFGISIHTLSRLFKDKVGIGFSEYLSMKRIENGRQLLITTDKSISEIAAESGFNQADYFSKLFKATYNETPSGFRNNKLA